MSDHRENIRDAARFSTEFAIEHGSDDFADVVVWKRDGGHKVEFLLGYGGPTIRVEVDSRWDSATYLHSWGMDDNGKDCDRFELHGEYAGFWVDMAEACASG